jgi:predicted thioesterase
MLSLCSGPDSQLRRWFKPTGLELADLFKVGTKYTEEKEVTSAEMKVRARRSGFVISTSSLAELLHQTACAVVSHTVPKNYHALVRQTQITHTAPLTIGEKMQVNLRVNSVLESVVCFDVDVFKVPSYTPAARGAIQIGVIKAELN